MHPFTQEGNFGIGGGKDVALEILRFLYSTNDIILVAEVIMHVNHHLVKSS